MPWANLIASDEMPVEIRRLLDTIPTLQTRFRQRCDAALKIAGVIAFMAKPMGALRDWQTHSKNPSRSRVCRQSPAGTRRSSRNRIFDAMEFGFLFDPDRQLLSIGYRDSDGSLDSNYYDLLASEARLASFIAIAKGDIPAKHWFRLGRTLTPVDDGSALISWSGSMFEYLMPSLVMRAPVGQPAGADQSTDRSPAAGIWRRVGRAVGNVGIRIQRARHRADLSIFQLWRAGSRLQARARRKHRHRALCERAGMR